MIMHQGTRRRESSCSNLRTPNIRSRATTVASELRESSTPPENMASATNSGCSLLENAKQETGDTSLDNARITMRTRVAVRDKTPHRFQVVPLRDVGRISGNNFTFTENRTPPGEIPVTPKKGSNRNFSTASSFDWKHKSDLTPSDATPPKLIPSNCKNFAFYGSKMAVNHTSAFSTEAKRMNSVRSRTFSSSFSASDRRSTVLSEWDVNSAENRKPTHDLDTTSYTPSPMSIDSIHELIRSESPLTQTISRSLRSRTTSVNVIKQSKSSNLGNMASFNSQQAESPSDAVAANVQRLSHDRLFCHDSDDPSYYSLLDAYKSSESTPAVPSTKRHAIYTPSLYVPHCDQVNSDNDIGPSLEIGPFCLDSGGQELLCEPIEDPLPEEDPDTTIRPEGIHVNQDGLATINDLSMSDDFPGLKHKSSSRSLPLCVPRGLNHSKPLHSVKYTGTADGSRPGAMVYPRIVLSLFADLDIAIDEWSR